MYPWTLALHATDIQRLLAVPCTALPHDLQL